MGDETEASILLDEEWMHDELKDVFFDEEIYNKIRYEDDVEYNIVLHIRRGQPKT